MSAIEKDFDRLALLDTGGWTQNNHYHNLLLRYIPTPCERALEIGCGTGAFSRRLAQRAQEVVALDLSSEMIRVARSHCAALTNLQFQVADFMSWDAPGSFDCIATIATLHHLPARAAFEKLKTHLRPGGMLLILDLFEPERNLMTAAGIFDAALNISAMAVSGSLRLVRNGRLKPPRAVRAAWEEHGKTDAYLTMSELRSLGAEIFPGSEIRKRLLWRYSLIWRKEIAVAG